jgi:uncharacterized protein (DUF362 family)
MDNRVFIVRCPDYEEVGDKITELVAMMTGMGSFAASGEKIVLKVNLLQPAKPEHALTTHILTFWWLRLLQKSF